MAKSPASSRWVSRSCNLGLIGILKKTDHCCHGIENVGINTKLYYACFVFVQRHWIDACSFEHVAYLVELKTRLMNDTFQCQYET